MKAPQQTAVDPIVHIVCHRHRLSPAEAGEFRAYVARRLAAQAATAVRGRRRHRTVLTILVQRWYLEYLKRVCGTSRPSLEACRLGPTAIRLESLMMRDGLAFDLACQALKRHDSVALTEAELAAVAALLPSPRQARVSIGRACLDPAILADYIDGRSTKNARGAVEMHLARCQACCFVLSEAV